MFARDPAALPSATPAPHPLQLVAERIAEGLGYGEEHLAEAICQYRSECAMFGDAGPGQALAIHQTRELLAADRRALRAIDRKLRRLRVVPKHPKPEASGRWVDDDIPF